MRPLLLAVLLLALIPTAASASKPNPLRVQIIRAECPDLSADMTEGCAYPDGRIYLQPGSSAFLAAHEMGHEFDWQRLTDGDHNWFAKMAQIRGPWSDWKREVFADAYANCAIERNRWTHHGAYDASYDGGHFYNPTPRRHKAICAGIARIATRTAR
jgi:hypothetical protein